MTNDNQRASRGVYAAVCLALIVGCTNPLIALPDRKVTVLFVGNSLTYYNDLPGTVVAMAATQSPAMEIRTEMLAEGGATLKQHLAAGVLQQELRRTQYDFVVLQDMGGWPICPVGADGCDSFKTTLSKAISLARQSGAEPVWFSTWQMIPAAQKALTAEVLTMAHELDVTMLDVGAAIFEYRESNDGEDPLLHNGHPTTTGTEIAAVGMVATIQRRVFEVGEDSVQVCGTPWQGHNLLLRSLSSSQASPDVVCSEVGTRELQRMADVANNALHPISQ